MTTPDESKKPPGPPGYAYSYILELLYESHPTVPRWAVDEKIKAPEALAMGLINRVVPDEELEAATAALSRRFAEGPPIAYAGIKRNLNAAETATLEQTMTLEAPANVRASMSHDGKEAGMAFLEKRKPVFRGY